MQKSPLFWRTPESSGREAHLEEMPLRLTNIAHLNGFRLRGNDGVRRIKHITL